MGEIRVLRFPSRLAIAFEVAPLVRHGWITDREGHELVEFRYLVALAELRTGARSG